MQPSDTPSRCRHRVASELSGIVDFELGLFSAQSLDFRASLITNVRGLNDNAALGKPTSFVGHCSSCHDTPGVGGHSLPLPLDIGTAHTVLPGLESDPAIAAAAADLNELVNFYDRRFSMKLTEEQKEDLVVFLNSL